MRKLKFLAAVMGAAVGLAGCAHTQIQTQSQVGVPPQFEQTQGAHAEAALSRWWESWHDPVLTGLIETALASNRNLAALQADLKAARAQAALAQADLGPQAALKAGAGANWAQGDNPLYAVNLPRVGSPGTYLQQMGSPLGDNTVEQHGSNAYVGFAASWEPDIFGAQRSRADAARYGALSQAEQLHGAQMLLAADIADNYFKTRALQERIRIGKESVAALRQMYRYVQGRFKAGQATDFEVKEVAAKLSALEAKQALLEAQTQVWARNIAQLTGQTPQGFRLPEGGSALNHIPAPPSGQVPLTVLSRRPDVRARAFAIKAMSAKLASAQAERLPHFSLQFLGGTGQVSLGSDLASLKGLGSLVSVGITVPIFSAGRIQSNIDMADAKLQAAQAQYDDTVLKALSEVDNAYQMQFGLRRQNRLLNEALQRSRAQAQGADKLFRYGHITLDKALGARLSVVETAEHALEGRLAEAQNMLNLYKALGGGWEDGAGKGAASPSP